MLWTVTPRKKLNDISRTKTPLKTAVKPLEEAVEYVLINNVCTQTSFSLEKEDHKEVDFVSNLYYLYFKLILIEWFRKLNADRPQLLFWMKLWAQKELIKTRRLIKVKMNPWVRTLSNLIDLIERNFLIY